MTTREYADDEQAILDAIHRLAAETGRTSSAELRPCRACTFRNAERERFDFGPPLPVARAVVPVAWPADWLCETLPYREANGRSVTAWVCADHVNSQYWPANLWRELFAMVAP